MTRLVGNVPTVDRLAESIVENDRLYYDMAMTRWLDDADISQVIGGEESIHRHRVFSGYSVARQSLMVVAKDLWRRDNDPRAYFVGEQSLVTEETKTYSVVSSSVDAARHLWVQILDPAFPASRQHALQSPRYDQRRIELSLDLDYRASELKLNLGLVKSFDFADIAGLDALVQQVERRRFELGRGDYQLAVA